MVGRRVEGTAKRDSGGGMIAGNVRFRIGEGGGVSKHGTGVSKGRRESKESRVLLEQGWCNCFTSIGRKG